MHQENMNGTCQRCLFKENERRNNQCVGCVTSMVKEDSGISIPKGLRKANVQAEGTR